VSKPTTVTLELKSITVVPLTKAGVAKMAEAITWNFPLTKPDPRLRRLMAPKLPHIKYVEDQGGYRWILMNSRNDEMVVSEEVFASKGSAKRDVLAVQKAFALAVA
jgi:uncharacterized protein YegP (UPF0339 family)